MGAHASFRPHVWEILFSLQKLKTSLLDLTASFRPHVWGFFFHSFVENVAAGMRKSFRPHVWGFFFHW